MLEFIGIIALAWIGFKLIRKFYGGAVLGMQIQAIEYATEHSVPSAFAAQLCKRPEIIRLTIQTLSRIEPGFAQVKGSGKYGRAIVYLYACHLQAEAKELAENLEGAKAKLVAFVKPQIEELEAGGFHLYINEVVYAYIGALACKMAGGSVSLGQIHDIMLAVFKNKVSPGALDNAYGVVQMAESDFIEKLAALIPVAQEELAVRKGAYLVKHIKKVNIAFEEKASGEPRSWQDFPKTTLQQYLGLDA